VEQLEQHGEAQARGAALVTEQRTVGRAQRPAFVGGLVLKQIFVLMIRDNGPSCLRAAAPRKAKVRRLRSSPLS